MDIGLHGVATFIYLSIFTAISFIMAVTFGLIGYFKTASQHFFHYAFAALVVFFTSLIVLLIVENAHNPKVLGHLDRWGAFVIIGVMVIVGVMIALKKS